MDAARQPGGLDTRAGRAAALNALHDRIACRFARAEPRRRALAYLHGLLAPIERKSSSKLAEQAGEATPDGMQRLLSSADWDADLVRDDLRGYIVEHLGNPAAVLAVGEISFVKKGDKSVGVHRQYLFTTGRLENCQLGLLLAYCVPRGQVFIDRELYLPRAWAEDQRRRHEGRVPDSVKFRAKPLLAREMLERALGAGVPAAWVTCEEVGGWDQSLRGWLEQRELPYVLPIKPTEPLPVDAHASHGSRVTPETLAARVPPEKWLRPERGGDGTDQGCHRWTCLRLSRPPGDRQPASARRLLIRRESSTGALTPYLCSGSPGTTSLIELMRVAETCRSIGSAIDAARQESGLHRYQVRHWPGWYRHITLALAAHASLVIADATPYPGCQPTSAAVAADSGERADRPCL